MRIELFSPYFLNDLFDDFFVDFDNFDDFLTYIQNFYVSNFRLGIPHCFFWITKFKIGKYVLQNKQIGIPM